MNKKKQQTMQTRKKISDAARVLFAQKGYKATSIEDIVKATRCSAGNIYYHFKNKEGLFLSLLEEWNIEWDTTWLNKEKSYVTTIEKLYGMAEYLAFDQLNHPLTKASAEFFNNAEKTPEVEERIHKLNQEYLDFNKHLLQKGIENAEFEYTHLTHLAIILDSLFIGLNQHSRLLEKKDVLAIYRLAIDIFLHGIVKST